ncbi:uncharacterized protein VOLCADRAFT_101517, partial [Volvox carteri f. nagariensis]
SASAGAQGWNPSEEPITDSLSSKALTVRAAGPAIGEATDVAKAATAAAALGVPYAALGGLTALTTATASAASAAAVRRPMSPEVTAATRGVTADSEDEFRQRRPAAAAAKAEATAAAEDGDEDEGHLQALGAPHGCGMGRRAVSGSGSGSSADATGDTPSSAAASMHLDIAGGSAGPLAATEARRRFLHAVRDRLEVLKMGLDGQVLRLMSPPPPRWLPMTEAEAAMVAEAVGAGSRGGGSGGGGHRRLSLLMLPSLALELRLGSARPWRGRAEAGAGAEAAEAVGGAKQKYADEGAHDSVRQLLDELEVELAVEAHSGVLSEAAGWDDRWISQEDEGLAAP